MKKIKLKKFKAVTSIILIVLMVLLATTPTTTSSTINYGNITLTGGYTKGHFNDIWDLTAGDITISFTYDGNGLVDDYGGSAHAWAELGVRTEGFGDFNPYGTINICDYDTTVDLIAGQNINVGEVKIWNDGDTLFVKYLINEPGWVIILTHLHITDDWTDIPQKNGNPIPGKFMYKKIHIPGVNEYTYTIDFTDLRGSDPLYVAAHAIVKNIFKLESAWADGEDFPGKNWAMYSVAEPSCTTITGAGVWLATDYDWSINTFDPDPVGAPTLDLDDKLILQKQGGQGEGAYDLPSVPPNPWANHRFWWDRDGVDPWQNGETANTGGIYQIVISLHATSSTTGTAYMNIRGLDQGFEVDGNWNTIELIPAGMTFTGDMEHLQIFYGLYGYGATHTVTFSDITVTQVGGLTHYVPLNYTTITPVKHPIILRILRAIMQHIN